MYLVLMSKLYKSFSFILGPLLVGLVLSLIMIVGSSGCFSKSQWWGEFPLELGL